MNTAKNIKPLLTVEINVFENDQLIDSLEFSGSKVEVIDFINFNYSKALLKSFFEAVVKFRINKKGDFQTLEELVEKEVFIL